MEALFCYRSPDEAATERLGAVLAKWLPAGSVVALDGPLGAGKTRLVQAIASGCGVDRGEVVSPTFVLVHEYQGTRPIVHIDAYRLRDEDDFLQLGALEYFGPPNLVLVEWASRVAGCLPEERLQVTISVVDQHARQFDIRGSGRFVPIVEQIRGELASR